METIEQAWKIRIGEVFRVPHGAAIEGSDVPSYLKLTRGTCAKAADLQKGMFFYASVHEPGQTFGRLPAFVFHTNPYKKDTEGTPWIDVVEPDVGYALFHGDNRRVARSPLEGRGNQKFAEVQHLYFETERRVFAPPILVFTQKEMFGNRKGYREFSGYGVPVRCTLNTQRERKSSRYFSNLTIELALFHLAKENELFDWTWIDARRNGKFNATQILRTAPDAWRDWVKNGHSAIERCRRNVARNAIVRSMEQTSLTSSERGVLDEVFAYYANKKHPFEGLASYVATRIIGHGCKRGWVTKRSGDMGIDFVCRLDVGDPGGQMCGKDILYVVEAHEYYVWDETRWCRDAGDVMMLRFAKAVTEQMFEEANSLPEDQRTALRRFALKSQDSGRLKAMVGLAKMYVRNVRYTEFDQNPLLLNVLNGTLDLTTANLLKPRRGDLMTMKAPVKYDPEDKFTEWDDILMDWMQGDREKVKYLQRMAGYAMTGLTDEEVLDILWGPGRNGKTKFYKTIYNVLGDDCYAKAANFDSFVVSKGDAGMPNDIAGWRGKRLIVASEGEHSKRLAEAKLKLVTGGDPVVGEFKFQEEFTYDPTYKIWLVSNPKPRIVGTDNAIWSRVHFVSWNRFYAEHERDPKLQDKLNAHLSAILNWMLEGCLEWQKQGLNPPASMREDMAQYRKNQDTIGRFVDDEFVIDEESTSPKRVTYNAYKRWAEEVGEHYILTLAEFNEKMQERFADSRSGSVRFWKGFRLKHEIDTVLAETGNSYEDLEKAIQ